ncbi:MAG TPA: enoyl-CoA hydratase-related protein, partial [candidate division Zixibacteria bacterium]|nr:enoyl-CoA hydratase-related protein [candidate division Zixibacteria bacterium]
AADRARFGQPEIAVGVFPPVAAAAFPHWVTQKILYELMLTGRPFSAEEARQCGLVNHCYPQDDFEERATEFLASLGKHSPLIGRYTKRALRVGAAKPFSEALAEIEELYLGPLMATQDADEGLQAFMSKRSPIWKNK